MDACTPLHCPRDATGLTTETRKAPSGLWGLILVLGPSLVWCGEYIGSDEVIIATRTGGVLGSAVMWAVVAGIGLKYWIGLCGARYTVVTGEGMVDCFSRVPGPRNWLVWVVFVGQIASGICAVGALAVAASTFLGGLVPLGRHLRPGHRDGCNAGVPACGGRHSAAPEAGAPGPKRGL